MADELAAIPKRLGSCLRSEESRLSLLRTENETKVMEANAVIAGLPRYERSSARIEADYQAHLLEINYGVAQSEAAKNVTQCKNAEKVARNKVAQICGFPLIDATSNGTTEGEASAPASSPR